EQAALLWGAVEGIRAVHGVTAPVDEDGAVEARTVALVYAALDTDVVDRAVARGRALSLPEAIHHARQALDAVQRPRRAR
ncbi:MAG TPA: hypothetical protein VFU78_15405, partial [Thermomicrobiales bacterium]|nr:hypothetical protein [Thermomicrobiales bacterium]